LDYVQKIMQAKQSKPFDPIGSVLRHWFETIIFGSIAFLILAPFGVLLSKPFYEVDGKIRIDPVISTLLGPTEDFSITAYYHDYARTQVNRIKDPVLLEEVLEGIPDELREYFIIKGRSIAFSAKVLSRRLNVSQVRDTHLVKLSLSGETFNGLAQVVNRIIDVFLGKHLDEEEGKNNNRLNFLKEEKNRLELEISDKIRLKNDIAMQAGTSTFSEMYNIVSRQLQDLQEAYTRAYSERTAKENLLEMILAEQMSLKDISLEPLVDEMVEQDQSLWDTSFWTYKTLQEMRASIDGVTENNPDRKYVDERMKGMESYLAKLRQDVRSRAEKIIYQKRDVELEEKIVVARSEYRAAKETEDDLRRERNRVQEQSAKITEKILKGQQVETELIHLQALLDRTDDRMHVLKLESRAVGRVRLESRAQQPEQPAGNNRNKFLAIFFILSFGGAIGGAVIYDLFDDRIRSPQDIENALGFPPTWPISDYLRIGRKDVPFFNVGLAESESQVAKAIRSLAVRNDKERRQHGARVALFTGVDSKSGVTGIMLNMAHAMTGLCGKVLVIEANHFSPCLAALYLNGNDREELGFFDLLHGSVDFTDCVVRDEERKLDLLLAGKRMSNDELASLQYNILENLLNELSEMYDYIIIDSAPILRTDFTEYLAVQIQVCMLVIQGDRTMYSGLRRATEILSRLELPAIAAVLNWGAPRQYSRFHILVTKFLANLRKIFRV